MTRRFFFTQVDSGDVSVQRPRSIPLQKNSQSHLCVRRRSSPLPLVRKPHFFSPKSTNERNPPRVPSVHLRRFPRQKSLGANGRITREKRTEKGERERKGEDAVSHIQLNPTHVAKPISRGPSSRRSVFSRSSLFLHANIQLGLSKQSSILVQS